ncbi:diuretic hormone receptor-like [Tachypleus tridentatus]|uniref:diuretic hormone receptor-like n=1 Tax=Tachypleus tridentatus TaxID=6853 RepID=UPI003FD2F91F
MSWTRGNRTRWDIQQDFVNNSWSALSCSLQSFQTYSTSKNGEPIRCNVTWDGLSCWPSVPAGFAAEISCFPELKGIRYNTSENATRLCYENGTWANRSDYSKCNPLISEDTFLEVRPTNWSQNVFSRLQTMCCGMSRKLQKIYYIGYGISLLASLVALTIFVYFKDLRCLRNIIHTNLIVTFILLDMTWIITANFQLLPNHTVAGTRAACVLVIFLTYLLGTNFFWMFVEGLYLYVLVVKTFSFEIFKVQIYAFVGWGLPAIVVLIWALSKVYFSPLPSDTFLLVRCPWQIRDSYDYIFIVPVIVVLLINVFFLGQIMWVLITKLRAVRSNKTIPIVHCKPRKL